MRRGMYCARPSDISCSPSLSALLPNRYIHAKHLAPRRMPVSRGLNVIQGFPVLSCF